MTPRKIFVDSMPSPLKDLHRRYKKWRALSPAAKLQDQKDRYWGLANDPGPERAIDVCLAWLASAQDNSKTADGGVARHFCLIDGWGSSYPEITGYTVPTLLREASAQVSSDLSSRARYMLDWLVHVQLPNGGFQGGMVDQEPVVPVSFNTGQIILGLAAGTKIFQDERYREAMNRAAGWLVETQDPDGCWRRYPTPFAVAGSKTYETHLAWGLFEAERVAPGQGYGEAGLKQVRWALTKQHNNGWFSDCCLDNPHHPLTHTIGYALRGILEAYRFSGDREILEAAIRTGANIRESVHSNGFLAGRFNKHWNPTVSWSCLTGSVQMALCWFRLFTLTEDLRYLEAGIKVNEFVRRTIAFDSLPDQRGGIRGSFPISGGYGSYQYLGWAAKFAIDSFREEIELRSRESSVSEDRSSALTHS